MAIPDILPPVAPPSIPADTFSPAYPAEAYGGATADTAAGETAAAAEGGSGVALSPSQLLGAGGLAALFLDPSLLRRAVEMLLGIALVLAGVVTLAGRSPVQIVKRVGR